MTYWHFEAAAQHTAAVRQSAEDEITNGLKLAAEEAGRNERIAREQTE